MGNTLLHTAVSGGRWCGSVTGDESDRSFGAFVLVSLILHAMLFFVFLAGGRVGNWSFAGPGGGIISVVPIEIQQPCPERKWRDSSRSLSRSKGLPVRKPRRQSKNQNRLRWRRPRPKCHSLSRNRHRRPRMTYGLPTPAVPEPEPSRWLMTTPCSSQTVTETMS